VESHETGHKI